MHGDGDDGGRDVVGMMVVGMAVVVEMMVVHGDGDDGGGNGGSEPSNTGRIIRFPAIGQVNLRNFIFPAKV